MSVTKAELVGGTIDLGDGKLRHIAPDVIDEAGVDILDGHVVLHARDLVTKATVPMSLTSVAAKQLRDGLIERDLRTRIEIYRAQIEIIREALNAPSVGSPEVLTAASILLGRP